jgi:hypothetical protein
MKKLAFGIFVVSAVIAAACAAPKFISYRSVSGDFSAYVPWGWNVIAEADHDSFSEVKFLGQPDASFYLGTPSLSVRWYKRYRAHTLSDGRLEMYADADDFIKQMLQQVYGPNSVLVVGGRTYEKREELQAGQSIPETVIPATGLTEKYFGVLSPAPAQPSAVGAGRDVDGNWHNYRFHEYALIPMQGGFYVITYPATIAGHDKYLDRFNKLAISFHPYTDGPGGEKVMLRPVEPPKKPL